MCGNKKFPKENCEVNFRYDLRRPLLKTTDHEIRLLCATCFTKN